METIIDRAYRAMEDALCDSATVPLEYNPLGFNTGLSVTLEDLERLFSLMAKAAHLFRLHDGPAPEHWADTWKGTVSKCAAVCRAASMEYLSLCINKGQPIAGDIRRRLDSWEYMAHLFASWPARSGCTSLEPSTIAAAAGIHSAEADPEAKKEPTLYHLNTTLNQQELARIFTRLVKDGFIDGSAPDAQADFLNAFNPAAEKQGRITWKKKAKNHGLNKMAICDFLHLFGITEREDLKEYANAIFGISISKSTLTNSAGGSSEHDTLRTIIDG